MFGSKPKPPDPLPPPANPPTFASAATAAPSVGGTSRFAGLGQSILTSPSGLFSPKTSQRKSLLGQ